MLEDIGELKSEIKLPNGKSFDVWGLSLEDLVVLLKDHSKELGKLFNGEVDINTVTAEAPELAYSIIAVAAKEPDNVDYVRKLGAGLQAEALEAIWDLTIPNEEALGKLVNRLIAASQKYQGLPGLDIKPKDKPTKNASKTGENGD